MSTCSSPSALILIVTQRFKYEHWTDLGDLLAIDLDTTFHQKCRALQHMPELVRESGKRRAEPRVGPTQTDHSDLLELLGVTLNERIDKRRRTDSDRLDLGLVDFGLFQRRLDGVLDTKRDIWGGGGFVGCKDGSGRSGGEIKDDSVADDQ